jgi:hypothetical protein
MFVVAHTDARWNDAERVVEPYCIEELDTGIVGFLQRAAVVDGAVRMLDEWRVCGLRPALVDFERLHEHIAQTTADAKEWAAMAARMYPATGTGRIWLGGCTEEQNSRLGLGAGGGHVLLALLSNLATPCHYKFCTSLGEFGTKANRRAERDKPLYVVVGGNRQYHEWKGADRVLEVGFRRHGHWRFLWKSRGIPRLSLSPVPEERRRKAIENDVPHIWVRPHWVGPRNSQN